MMKNEKEDSGGGRADMYRFKSKRDLVLFVLFIIGVLLLCLYLLLTDTKPA